MIGIGFKQFKRTYPGGYQINFPICLSASNDFKVKNYTNFYLTDESKFGNFFDVESQVLKANSIYTPIQFGQSFLKFSEIDPRPYAYFDRSSESDNYGACGFTATSGLDTMFTIDVLDNNQCYIYHTNNYKKYYLCSDDNNQLVFARDKVLTFSLSTINPQDFRYLFSEDENFIFFYQSKPTAQYYVGKTDDSLVLVALTNYNITDNIGNPFKICRNIYTRPHISFNTSFIAYDDANNIDMNNSRFDLSNNYLLHRKYSDEGTKTDIIVLKNQLLQDNVFSSSNNLLSSLYETIFVDGLREYTSILEDIQQETCDNLELNYVFYNQSYTIKAGSNDFISPSSMYPFTKLNINDSKFIDSGAFSFTTPEYADKVYRFSNDPQTSDNGQYLLCTWLSGAPLSPNKVWVDRYYYPDLIQREAALSANPVFHPTYNNLVEQLMLSNSGIRNSINTTKFFDKKSDLVFEPSVKYIYQRIDVSEFPVITQTISKCLTFSETYPLNYFTRINDNGMFTVGLYFSGNSNSWITKSDRNGINSGITIEKTATEVNVLIDLFDPAYNTHTSFTVSTPFKDLKENFVCVSIDSFEGIGYVYFNNKVILPFKLPLGQFYKKSLLYGDFFIFENDKKTNILNNAGTSLNGVFVLDIFIDSDMVFILPIIEGRMVVDTLHLTLPCGMRNSIDDIEYIQSICGSNAFKSNDFNVKIKNLNISNENVLKGIEDSITTTLTRVLPPTSRINSIDFENYK